MPARYPTLDVELLREDLARTLFSPSPSAREEFGITLELFPVRWPPRSRGFRRDENPPALVPLEPDLRRWIEAWASERGVALQPADERPFASGAAHGRLHFGNGGQLGYSSAAAATPAAAFEDAADVLDALGAALEDHGVSLLSIGADPWRDLESAPLQDVSATGRCLDLSFAHGGEAGRRLLRQSAGASVRIASGGPLRNALRWRGAQLLAPVASACFAFSPLSGGAHLGFKGLRAQWRRTADATRTGFPPANGASRTPLEEHLQHALHARLLWIRYPERWVPPARPLSFAHWLERGHDGDHPEIDDWRHHLATLLPEVRPLAGTASGTSLLELGSSDSQPRAFWSVPLTFWSALLCDDGALSEVTERLGAHGDHARARWEAAARGGLIDARLAEDARAVFACAAGALLRVPPGWISREMVAAFVAFGQRYALCGRTPADELLELFLERGALERDTWERLDRESRAAAGTPSRARSAGAAPTA